MVRDTIIRIGVITGPHGLRGQVRIRPYNPESELFGTLESLFLDRGSRFQEIRLLQLAASPKFWRATLEGTDGREAAENLKGVEVGIPRDWFPDEDDAHYHVDLIGLRVLDEHGAELGRVERIQSYPTVDCLVVPAVLDATQHLEIPFLEPWLVKVDMDRGEIHVSQIEELLDVLGGSTNRGTNNDPTTESCIGKSKLPAS